MDIYVIDTNSLPQIEVKDNLSFPDMMCCSEVAIPTILNRKIQICLNYRETLKIINISRNKKFYASKK